MSTERSGTFRRVLRLVSERALGAQPTGSASGPSGDGTRRPGALPMALDGCVGCGMCGRHAASLDPLRAARHVLRERASAETEPPLT